MWGNEKLKKKGGGLNQKGRSEERRGKRIKKVGNQLLKK